MLQHRQPGTRLLVVLQGVCEQTFGRVGEAVGAWRTSFFLGSEREGKSERSKTDRMSIRSGDQELSMQNLIRPCHTRSRPSDVWALAEIRIPNLVDTSLPALVSIDCAILLSAMN